MSGAVRIAIVGVSGAVLIYCGVVVVVSGLFFHALAPFIVGAVLWNAALEEALEGDDGE